MFVFVVCLFVAYFNTDVINLFAFYFLFFFCLQSFDRWARDLAMGDYAFLKNKYARLWAETSWLLFSTVEGTAAQQEPLNAVSYAQQLLAEYQHENNTP